MGATASLVREQSIGSQSRQRARTVSDDHHSRGRAISMDDINHETFGDYVIDSHSLRFTTIDSNISAEQRIVPKSDTVRLLIQNGLKGNFIFDSLSQQQLDRLIDVFTVVKCQAGDTIIEQGASGGSDHMYVIETGAFKVEKKGQGIISCCSSGDTFGELSLLYGAKRSSSVTCTENASLWALDRQTFRYYQALSDKKMSEFICAVLEKVYSFKLLQKNQMEKAAEISRTVDYLEGDIICRKGEFGSDFYIVLDGVVNCSTSDNPIIPSESEPSKLISNDIICRLKAGDWFGEESLSSSPYLSNVTADSSIRLLAFNRDMFENVVGSLKDIVDRKQNEEMLMSLPLLERAPVDKRDRLIEMFSMEEFKDGATLSACGDPNARIIIIKSGFANVWRPVLQPIDATSSATSRVTTSRFNPSARYRTFSNSSYDSANTDGNHTKEEVDISDQASRIESRSRSNSDSSSSTLNRLQTNQAGRAASLEKFEMITPLNALSFPTTQSDELIMPSRQGFVEIGVGEFVGHDCLLNSMPMDCTVIAKGDVTCFVLTREDLSALSCCSQETFKTSSKKNHIVDDSLWWSNLVDMGCIGKGTFGTVYMVQDANSRKTYAVKVVNRERMRLMKNEKRLETERNILKEMDSPFICKYYGIQHDEHSYYMLMEMLQGGELKSLVYPRDAERRELQRVEIERGKLGGIPHQAAMFYLAAISIPLIYLHRRNIVYRDLKLENIMIDRFGYPKLIDFGLAKNLNECTGGKTYTLCGTPEYLAPEVILGLGHGRGVDYWTLGILLYEMVGGLTPFRGKHEKFDEMTVFENIVEHRLRFPEDMEPGCIDLIQRLLTKKAAMRLGGGRKRHKEFEEHGWFEGSVDWHAMNLRQVNPPWIPALKNSADTSCFKLIPRLAMPKPF